MSSPRPTENSVIQAEIAEKIKIYDAQITHAKPLLEAIKAEDVGAVGCLIDDGAHVNYHVADEEPNLTAAVNTNNRILVQLLLSKGADANFQYAGKNSNLMRAVENDNRLIVRLLMDFKADTNYVNSNKQTVYDFIKPTTSGNMINELLLAHCHQLTLLDKLLFENDLHGLEEYFLRHAKVKNISSHLYGYKLFTAVSRKSIGAAQQLLRAGANLHRTDHLNNDIFSYAIERDCFEILKALILASNDGKSYNIHNAFIPPHSLLTAAIKYDRVNVVEFLLDQDADLSSNQSPILQAAKYKRVEILKALLQRCSYGYLITQSMQLVKIPKTEEIKKLITDEINLRMSNTHLTQLRVQFTKLNAPYSVENVCHLLVIKDQLVNTYHPHERSPKWDTTAINGVALYIANVKSALQKTRDYILEHKAEFKKWAIIMFVPMQPHTTSIILNMLQNIENECDPERIVTLANDIQGILLNLDVATKRHPATRKCYLYIFDQFLHLKNIAQQISYDIQLIEEDPSLATAPINFIDADELVTEEVSAASAALPIAGDVSVSAALPIADNVSVSAALPGIVEANPSAASVAEPETFPTLATNVATTFASHALRQSNDSVTLALLAKLDGIVVPTDALVGDAANAAPVEVVVERVGGLRQLA